MTVEARESLIIIDYYILIIVLMHQSSQPIHNIRVLYVPAGMMGFGVWILEQLQDRQGKQRDKGFVYPLF